MRAVAVPVDVEGTVTFTDGSGPGGGFPVRPEFPAKAWTVV